MVSFTNYNTTEPSDSQTAAIDIMSNSDYSQCPDNCFRPVGLAFDSQGRLFVSSDNTGEVYVIRRTGSDSITNTTMTAAPTAAPTSARNTQSVTSQTQSSQTQSGTVAAASPTTSRPSGSSKMEAMQGIFVVLCLIVGQIMFA